MMKSREVTENGWIDQEAFVVNIHGTRLTITADCFATNGFVMACCAVYGDGKEEKDRAEFNLQQLARASVLFSSAPDDPDIRLVLGNDTHEEWTL